MKLFNREKKQEETKQQEVHTELENKEEIMATAQAEEEQEQAPDPEEKLKKIAMLRVIYRELLEELSIAETIHVIKYLEVFQKASPLENYEDNHTVVAQTIFEKIKEAPVLYVMFDDKTELPFVATGFAELYSKKEYAEQAVSHYAEQFRSLSIREVTKEDTKWLNGVNLFAYFYYLGMDEMLIDNGQQAFAFKREEILETPDWSNLDAENKPVLNGDLRFWMNVYLEEARWEVSYEGHEERVNQLEEEMVKRLLPARFLVPVVTDEETGQVTKVATLSNTNKEAFLPMFTDWFEFDKVYDQEVWNAMVISFQEGIQYGLRCTGLAINPRGENIMMSKEIMKKRFPELISVE
ncbi:MAG: SseB family protein [bacterium]|nr:SseB family protein [bacterium]